MIWGKDPEAVVLQVFASGVTQSGEVRLRQPHFLPSISFQAPSTSHAPNDASWHGLNAFHR
jgi:hypothetical protein